MQPVIRSSLLLIALAGPAAAADPKPNALTPKQAAEGWIMLFDGETTFGWTVDGEAKVKDGKLVIGGKKPTTLTSLASFPQVQYLFAMEAAGGRALTGGGLYLSRAGTAELDFTSVINVEKSFGHSARNRDHSPSPVRIVVPAGQTVLVSKLLIRPVDLSPLFNGKDLTGWTVFEDPKRQQAKFSVTPAGELHVLGGPGDLQTTAKYADFILQTEVRTNGPMVNSGLFFRCIPGQYQNGYEVQIQNGFQNNDRTKPTDGGTGAIYRRQPARKVVPNDREWFTLTIAAHGPHIATWVNGYPTASWTDTRKPHENPRQGLRTAAGHLSLQGHNPPMSADVLFRNMRIASLEEEKKSDSPQRHKELKEERE